MRDANRLDKVYTIMCFIHKKCVPDWRMGQLISNFMSWHYDKYKSDYFYIEEDKFIDRFVEFCDYFNIPFKEVRPC
ncbi:MAG: hypothetical protein IKN65_06870 [Clostridia bacterium]|nr:hypothetical protein [Clostridia bacterium]